jgi:hydrogenase expression/formation protein HypD
VRYIDEYRDRRLVEKLVSAIDREATGEYRFMEVCGSHTHAIRRFGLPSLLPENIKLLSGPGCPVCVTGQNYINKALALAAEKRTIIATYGDLLRVPGNGKNLQECREEGADIRVVYSSLDALGIANDNPGKRVIFLAIGFETTAPATAAAAINSLERRVNNFYILCGHKTMPAAMKAVIGGGISLNGYICPGHVSAVTGSKIYEPLAEEYKVATVVSGFEPTDILQSVLMLIRQVNAKDFQAEIQYIRAVNKEGNLRALKIIDTVFEESDDDWRGFGIIPSSGLKLRSEYAVIDAEKRFSISVPEPEENSACICGDILRGRKKPEDCTLFAKICTPENPKGACMVSSEGSCNAHFNYRDIVSPL